MKKFKQSLSLVLSALLLAGLAACGGKAPASQEAPSSAPAPSQSAASVSQAESKAEEPAAAAKTQYPLTITTYNYGKEKVDVTFEKTPEKVYAQGQNNIEILLALGLGDKIVGASGLDGDVLADLQDEFAKIKYYDTMPSKEELLGLEPDFIIGWYSTFSEKRLDDVGFFHERNIGTYMSLNSACQGPVEEFPRTIENEFLDIQTIGIIFDVQDQAQALVDNIQKDLTDIEEYLSGKEKLSIAMLEDEGGTYRVYGEEVLGGAVAMAGGATLAVGKKGDSGNISAEDLIAANPDAIFMVWYDGYTVGDEDYAGDHVVKLITENPAFSSLDAVKNGRVYPINLSGIYCSGLRTQEGVLAVAQNLYPELYQ